MKKLLLMLFLALGSLLAQAQTAVAPAGSGTSTDPYQIATLDNLYWISQNKTTWSKYFTQTADIDATDTKNWDLKNDTLHGFSPIGNFYSNTNRCYFTGNYEGSGHSISNLYINRDTSLYVGLFGYSSGAIINNVNLVNANIHGGNSVGTLCGYIGGLVTNCSSSGIVTIDSLSKYAGGLVGQFLGGTIDNCHSSAMVSGYGYVGGLIGRAEVRTISNCYATGDVKGYSYVGGLVGGSPEGLAITNNYSTGTVTGYKYIGGLIGMVADYPTITNCYSKSIVNGNSYVGGFIGKTEGVYAKYCHSTGNVTGSNYLGGFIGYSTFTSVWIQYCYSTSNVSGSGTGKDVGGFMGYGTSIDFLFESYSSGNVSGNKNVGGFIGDLGTCYLIHDCYSTGNVVADSASVGAFIGLYLNGSAINNCYAIGSVTTPPSDTLVGAFIGDNFYSTLKVTGSYWNKETNKIANAIGNDTCKTVTGLTSAQMKRAENFNAWNFDTIWAIRTDSTYPLLRKVNNAPIALPDTLKGSAMKLSGLLANDFDYETQQTKLVYKIISCSNNYGTNTDSTFTFNSGVSAGATDSVTYRVGELIAAGDTLWGNQATAKLVYVADVATAVTNATPAATLSISPNPATDAFTVNGLTGSASVLITDVSGKLLIAKSINQGKAISVSNLPTGIYLVKISTADGVVQKKLIKK